jgi:hypothetical protein
MSSRPQTAVREALVEAAMQMDNDGSCGALDRLRPM